MAAQVVPLSWGDADCANDTDIPAPAVATVDGRPLCRACMAGVPTVAEPVKRIVALLPGVDYGELTDADVAMMRHALRPGVEEVDFSEFYEDDES